MTNETMTGTVKAWPGVALTISTPQDVLDDLAQRLGSTRFPLQQAGPDWATGTPIAYAVRLRDYWLNEFDWRAWEAKFNKFDNRMIEVDEQPIHVLIERGSGANPLPLLLTHGWPGSFTEFLGIVEELAHPERFGGDETAAFTVVVPSLPGYGWSPPPLQPQSPAQIARLWSKLMTECLGFGSYVAYGSDWGSLITAKLAIDTPDRLAAILITTSGGMPEIDVASSPLTPEEEAWQHQTYAKIMPESGYQLVQATKPESLAFGQTDSPMGLACWIVEKFHGWTINGQLADPPFSMDDMLANVMLYWINGCVAPMWLYQFLATASSLGSSHSMVPSGFIFAPHDMMPPAPRSFLERTFRVEHYKVLERGGHFPGLEVPDLLVRELRTFLGSYR